MLKKSLSQIGMTLGVMTLIAVPATALKNRPGRLVNPLAFQAPECAQRPEFLSESRAEVAGGFSSLPKSVLVARDAEMWVEGVADSNRNLKLHSYQSFVREKTRALGRILCGSTPAGFADRFSLMAPTLIDISSEQKVGNSLWQFQVIAQQDGYSVWNKKSPSMSKADKIENLFRSFKTPYHLYQISHNEYELLVQKESGGVMQTLSVRYEVLK